MKPQTSHRMKGAARKMPTKKAIFMYSISASAGPVKMNLSAKPALRIGWTMKWKICSRKPQQAPKPSAR